jgi:hypothetical protein
MENNTKSILTDMDGTKYLTVYYDDDSFDEAIRQALKWHGLKRGEVPVIAWPVSMRDLQ